MSTRSRLRAVLPNGTAFKPIYCHSDGYPSYMLPMLNTHYNNLEMVEKLMALGDLSFLAERVEPNPDEEHSFNKPVRGVTIAYHRDSGEDLSFNFHRQQYIYLYNGVEWVIE